MRFESKNRDGKISSHASISRINVCRLIAIKHQQSFNYRLLRETLDCKTPVLEKTENVQLFNLTGIHCVWDNLPHDLKTKNNVSKLKRVDFQGNTIDYHSVIKINTATVLFFMK